MNPFTYMFKDINFDLKALTFIITVALVPIIIILVAICKTPIFMLGYIIVFILMLLLSGYYLSCIQNIQQNKTNPALPYINKSDIGKGCTLFIANLVLVCFCLIIQVLLGLALQAANLKQFAVFFVLPLQLFIFIIMPMLDYMMAKKSNALMKIRWIKALKLIAKEPAKYIKACILNIIISLICAAFGIGFAFIANLAKNNLLYSINILIIYGVIMFVVYSYLFFVYPHIVANCSDAEIE